MSRRPSDVITIGSLCTGYGGIELGLAQTMPTEVAWHADNDPAAALLLAHRYPGVPNYGDLTSVDWASAQRVDVITAGWPCQPWSLAGRMKGAADERAIWPAIAEAIRAIRPGLVVLENVPAIAGAGELARACGDLAALGYMGSWRCLRASDAGAPHRRERIFIVAADTRRGELQRRGVSGVLAGEEGAGEGEGSERQRNRHAACNGDRVAADPGSEAVQVRLRPERPQPIGRSGNGSGIGFGATADTAGERRGERRAEYARVEGRPSDALGGDVNWAEYASAIERWAGVIGRPAPAPTVLGRRGPQLNPVFVEWVMGLPEGWVTGVPGLTRVQMLKLLGNGVVPRQCAIAVQSLFDVLEELEVAA